MNFSFASGALRDIKTQFRKEANRAIGGVFEAAKSPAATKPPTNHALVQTDGPVITGVGGFKVTPMVAIGAAAAVGLLLFLRR